MFAGLPLSIVKVEDGAFLVTKGAGGLEEKFRVDFIDWWNRFKGLNNIH